MSTSDVYFVIVGTITLVSALLAVTTKQVTHAAVWLVVSLGALAGCYLVLGAEFVALVQLLVYVGAVVVLVVFALMLTRAPIGRSRALDSSLSQRALALVLSSATATLVGATLLSAFGTGPVRLRGGGTDDLAVQIFGTWSWPFELLSLLLLIGLVTAVALARMPVDPTGGQEDDDA